MYVCISILCQVMLALNDEPFSMGNWTSKAVCPAEKGHISMKLKWNRYNSRQAKNPRFLYGVFLPFWKLLGDSIKTPFLAELGWIAWHRYHVIHPWLGVEHRHWSRHGVLRSMAVFYHKPKWANRCDAPSHSIVWSRHQTHKRRVALDREINEI